MAKILIVEDEALVAMEILETLERQGHIIPPVFDSADAVPKAVLTHNPDLIIMDIRLKSFIDGIDVVERLQVMRKTPVIYLTAYSDPDIKARALRTGPEAYLTKPFDSDELIDCVQAVLEKERTK